MRRRLASVASACATVLVMHAVVHAPAPCSAFGLVPSGPRRARHLSRRAAKQQPKSSKGGGFTTTSTSSGGADAAPRKKPRLRKKTLDELRQVSAGTDAATTAWAENLVARLDANAMADEEEALLDACKAERRDLAEIASCLQPFEGNTKNNPTAAVLALPRAADFRLVWAFSDDAVAEIGTGLHRVPLARLEDVFLSFRSPAKKDTKSPSQMMIRTSEVVRVIGPFPNVKNVLFGRCAVDREALRVSYARGVDGTGKPLNAERDVSFQVLHASERLCVLKCAGLPKKDDEVLVFEREDDFADALERLRVPAADDDADFEEEQSAAE